MGKMTFVGASLVLGLSCAVVGTAHGFLGAAPSQAATASSFQTITPLQAKALIESRPELQIIDVRSPEEFRQGALPGSVLIPFWDFMKGRYNLPKDKPVLLVCAVGGRSLAVGQLLSAKGYRELYNLKGGLDAWVEQRVPLPRRPTGR